MCEFSLRDNVLIMRLLVSFSIHWRFRWHTVKWELFRLHRRRRTHKLKAQTDTADGHTSSQVRRCRSISSTECEQLKFSSLLFLNKSSQIKD